MRDEACVYCIIIVHGGRMYISPPCSPLPLPPSSPSLPSGGVIIVSAGLTAYRNCSPMYSTLSLVCIGYALPMLTPRSPAYPFTGQVRI